MVVLAALERRKIKMFNEFDKQVAKPWAVYFYSSPGFRYCMARFASRADGEHYLGSIKRQVPTEFYPELVFDSNTEGLK